MDAKLVLDPGKFPRTDFAIDPAVPSATCPAGNTITTTGWSRDHKGRRVAVLKVGADRCDPCPLRERCTSSQAGRMVTLNFHKVRFQAAPATHPDPRPTPPKATSSAAT